ncbi:PASTA domain-containing protein [bacterium]|nr:PASTA domain-containing protein [bacterium]
MRSLKAALTVAIYSVILIILADKVIMPSYVHFEKDVAVPSVVKLEFSDAQKLLEKAGLTLSVKYRFEPTLPKNLVLNQSPEPGAIVKSGRVVRLILSQDELMVTVPSVKLTTLRDASFTLESIGLKVGNITHQPSPEFPAGVVIDQSISSNSKIRSGSSVDLIVSLGSTLTEAHVPYMISKTLLEAKTMIVESGLSLGKVTKKYHNDLLPGTIISQSLDSSQVVAPQTAIDLVVSSIDKDDE